MPRNLPVIIKYSSKILKLMRNKDKKSSNTHKMTNKTKQKKKQTQDQLMVKINDKLKMLIHSHRKNYKQKMMNPNRKRLF